MPRKKSKQQIQLVAAVLAALVTGTILLLYAGELFLGPSRTKRADLEWHWESVDSGGTVRLWRTT